MPEASGTPTRAVDAQAVRRLCAGFGAEPPHGLRHEVVVAGREPVAALAGRGHHDAVAGERERRLVPEVERQPEAVEAGAEVGGRRRDTRLVTRIGRARTRVGARRPAAARAAALRPRRRLRPTGSPPAASSLAAGVRPRRTEPAKRRRRALTIPGASETSTTPIRTSVRLSLTHGTLPTQTPAPTKRPTQSAAPVMLNAKKRAGRMCPTPATNGAKVRRTARSAPG